MAATDHAFDFGPRWIRRPGLRQGRCARVAELMLGWHERARQRRALLGLSDRALQDIGVSRDAADAEARKPFWRP